jgi:hypothetical protein
MDHSGEVILFYFVDSVFQSIASLVASLLEANVMENAKE